MGGAERPFGLRDKIGYLFGDFGNDFTFLISSSFLLKFYTDVMGIDAFVVGIVMMVVGGIKARYIVSGVGVGAMVDWISKTNPDKSWDYVFLGMIGIAIIGILVFMLMWGAKADGYDEEQTETKTENA